jgi:predicted DNA-binding transcriptional regulator AlpA
MQIDQNNENRIIETIAQRTADLIIQVLMSRQRNEISVREICEEYGISRQTVWRRQKNGMLPSPNRKRGKNIYSRSAIVNADLNGRL